MRPRRILRYLSIAAAAGAALVLLALGALYAAARYYASGATLEPMAQASLQASSSEPHRIRLYDSGVASLHQRLQLIESAQRSIELEFFIYNVDEASRLITHALIRKAQQGVAVRMLIDFAAPVFQLRPAYARFLQSQGIEVRYYNTVALYRIFSVQHRSHRKLLIVDGETVLTGGRNIGDDYFDLAPDYNFLDSDIQVSGPIAETVRASFELYWSSPLAARAGDFERVLDAGERARAERFFLPQAGDLALERRVREAGAAAAQGLPSFECRKLIFVTDFPDKGEGNRRVFAMISELMREARREIWVETPYFVIKEGGYALLERARAQGAQVKVLTNSLHSTDAFYTVAALYPDLEWLARTGLEMYAYSGAPPPAAPSSPAQSGGRWGIHAKRAVLDGRTVLIGTYNIDPRSANLNSELMLVCIDSAEFAQAVLASIRERVGRSRQLMARGQVLDEDALFGASGFRQKLSFVVALPFASLFDFLL